MTERGPVIPPGSETSYERFHFAPAFRVGDTLHVSGVIGVGADGTVPTSVEDEFTAAFESLAATLEAAGFDMADVVDLTTFHVDMGATLRPFMAAKDEAITEPYPAWTAIGCTELALPGARAEVKAMAVKR